MITSSKMNELWNLQKKINALLLGMQIEGPVLLPIPNEINMNSTSYDEQRVDFDCECGFQKCCIANFPLYFSNLCKQDLRFAMFLP